MLAMAEHRIALRGNPQAAEFGGQGREIADFDAAQVVDVAGIVRVVADAIRDVAHLARHFAEVLVKALPLRWNRGGALARIALAQTRDEKRPAVFKARRLQMREKSFVHFDRLHDDKIVEMTTRAQRFGREP